MTPPASSSRAHGAQPESWKDDIQLLNESPNPVRLHECPQNGRPTIALVVQSLHVLSMVVKLDGWAVYSIP